MDQHEGLINAGKHRAIDRGSRQKGKTNIRCWEKSRLTFNTKMQPRLLFQPIAVH